MIADCPLFSDISMDVAMATNFRYKLAKSDYIRSPGVPKRIGISPF